MPDETVATRPPWLDSSLPLRPCKGISVIHVHNSTESKPLRYALSGVWSAAPESMAFAPIITYKYRHIYRTRRIYACFIKKYLNALKYFCCFFEVVVFYAVEISLICDSCI